jgi:2-oxoacid:acceptor oxidoreductase gamma subunit (pyruvate/2-ketoisovalerate family)
MFGFERRGAPVTANGRFDEKPILEKTQIYEPNCNIVLDPSQSETPRVYDGLRPNGILILNSPKELRTKPHDHLTVAGLTDANRIAMEEIGMAAPNICMLGSFAATTNWIQLDSILAGLEDYFQGKNLDGNRRCAERGFKETRIQHF